MKTIWKVEKEGKEFYFAANITDAVIRLEKEFNCKVDATGFGADAWGFTYFRGRGLDVTDLKGIRKELKAMN